MAKSKDRKAQKAKARQESLRKQKAAVAAQPRMLRQNPDLAEALSPKHPLLGYYVNRDWAEARMASVHVIREAPSGQVFSGFLVDTAWRGTKDSYGNFAMVDALAELQERMGQSDPELTLVPLAPEAAVNLIRGGVAWARRWRYPLPAELDIWLRLVDPAPAWGLDMGMFGEGGERPITLGSLDEVARMGRLDPNDIRILPPEGLDWPDDDDLEDAEDEEELADPALSYLDAPASGLWLPPGVSPLTEEAPAPPPTRPKPSGLWLPPSWQPDEK